MDVTATCIFPENLYVVNAKSLICNVTRVPVHGKQEKCVHYYMQFMIRSSDDFSMLFLDFL